MSSRRSVEASHRTLSLAVLFFLSKCLEMSEQPSCSRIPVCLTPECVNVGSRLRGFSVIVATDVESGIARNGAIPWHSTEDLKHFRELTSQAAKGKKCCVIMGRRTWDSIPPQHRPLKNRINVVLSRSSPPPQLPPDVYFVNGPLSSVLHSLAIGSETVFCNCSEVDRVWVIGGAQVYQEALDPLGSCCSSIRSVFRTVVGANPHGCDLKLPSLPALLSQNDFVLEDRQAVHESASGEDSLVFEQWNRRNTQEEGYLGLCREIIDHGNVKSDRTGVGTRSIFGAQMRFSLRDGRLPLLTTKRVFWRGVCEELLWFVRRMRASCNQKVSTFGMEMRQGSFLTAAGCSSDRKATWGLSTVFSGGTLVQSTLGLRGRSTMGKESIS